MVLPTAPAFSQSWTGATDNNWFTATNWSGGVVPNSPSAIVVIDNGLNNPVILNGNASLFTLTLGTADSLNQTGGLLTVSGGMISNAGALDLASQVQLSGGDLTLAGPGMITLSGGQFGGDGYSRTLFNQTMLQGAGLIGSNIGALYQGGFSLNNAGVIDANSAGNTLTIQGAGSVFANSGLLEATGGGILNLATPNAVLTNNGGQISAMGAGSDVLVNVRVEGGTLTTSGGGVIETGAGGATLDGDTLGPITLTNASTYSAGTKGLTSALGTLTLDAGSTLALTGQLRVSGADLTLGGPGVVTMSGGAQIGGDGVARTLFNDTLISGSGVIGSNVGALYQGGFALNNAGTINADVAGSALVIQGSGAFTNTGLLEATAGGILNLSVPNNPLIDAGGVITASGAGSMVLINTEVDGGVLNTFAGGVMQTGSSGAFLNGSTSNGSITLSDDSTYAAGSNALTKAAGTLNLGLSGGAGATFDLTGQLQVAGADLTFAGPGAVIMSGGGAQIGGDGAARTLFNDVLIQGYGVIGSNVGSLYRGGFSLQNLGTIDANSSGNTLSIQGTGVDFINGGLLEATGGGILNLATPGVALNNSAGDVTASGAGSTVLVNLRVEGGNLNTDGGGVIRTGTAGAVLDGSTLGPVTFTDGAAYIADNAGLTQALGSLILDAGATLTLTDQLQINGADLTLSGPGALMMSGTAQIGGDGAARTLNNGSLIEGSGIIGSNIGALYSSMSVVNEASGTILANRPGQVLSIAGTGGLTNNGTLQADAGSTLNATRGFANFSGGTLSGGAYVANSGTIQINAFGTTGGEVATNDARVMLNGATALLSDASGLNALSMLSANASGASLTVEGGNQFATLAPSAFENNGAVLVGSGSTFSTASDYAQSGATSSTTVDGTLSPASGIFSLAGGRLTGSGSVTGDVVNSAGVVDPGDNIGSLTVLGYNQGAGGTLSIDIGGAMSNDLLNIEGSAILGGLLDPVLKSGFTPTLGESFVFMDYTSRTGSFSGIENAIFGGGAFMWQVTYNATDAVLTVGQGPGVSAAPEPSIWAMMIMSIGAMGLFLRRSKSSRHRRRDNAAEAVAAV